MAATATSKFVLPSGDSLATAQVTPASLFEQSGHNSLGVLTREYSEMLASKIRASQSRVS